MSLEELTQSRDVDGICSAEHQNLRCTKNEKQKQKKYDLVHVACHFWVFGSCNNRAPILLTSAVCIIYNTYIIYKAKVCEYQPFFPEKMVQVYLLILCKLNTFWLDQRHYVTTVLQFNGTGTSNFMYHSASWECESLIHTKYHRRQILPASALDSVVWCEVHAANKAGPTVWRWTVYFAVFLLVSHHQETGLVVAAGSKVQQTGLNFRL